MTQERNDKAIRTENLSRHFGSVVAVQSLDLVVPYGVIFGLLGSNGAGKSTTIKMLTTMLPPTGGNAYVAGFSILTDAVQIRRRMGYVSQMLSADGALTGVENLMLFARIYGIPRKECRVRVEAALQFMGLSEVGSHMVSSYSGGMIRRLEIAQSMLHRPKVLFLDEPTVGLDPVARHQVWQKLKEMRVSFGTTILLTTHDMEEADELCDRIAILQSGNLAVVGSPQELREQAGTDSMDGVFIHFSGSGSENAANYRDIRQTRRTARRMG
ncbi:MAG TPA: ATP-binding cassette domain-containing protein [Chlorobaculum sp.]|nr:ATP-binding cassette domain-containing protein [Chlorobaculum sp.]